MLRWITALAAAGLLAACGGGDDTSEPAMDEETAAAAGADEGLRAELDAALPWDGTAEGVQTTDSGLQYLPLRVTEEGARPTERDTVTVMYEGRIADRGETFDSSYARGSTATFPLGGVIPGWTEGLQLMSEGDAFLFFLPSELAYGQNPRPGGTIQPGDDLVFLVELERVIAAPPPRDVDAAAWAAYTPWDSDREEVVKTGSGLEYIILESGPEDAASPVAGETVVVYYEGRLDATGAVFDSAFERDQAAMFRADRLIPGWVEALRLMRRGDRWLIHVPAELAYGEEGTPGGPIPPNADLNFEVELMDVLPTDP